MAYPILAAQSTWFSPNISSVKRANITEIEIMDSYTPDASVTVTDSWDASAAKDGSITCYVIGTKLIMAGNGSGKIAANEDSSFMFADNAWKDLFQNVTKIENLNMIDSSNTMNFMATFYGAQNITSLDVKDWNTKNVNKALAMFAMCKSLRTIDVSNWDTSNLTSVGQIFSMCEALTELDLSHWRMDNVTSMDGMFEACSSLRTIGDVSAFNTSSVTVMQYLFNACKKLVDLDVSNWDVSKVNTMAFMFYQCSSLKEIDVSNWDVSKVTSFDHFAAHANLKRKGIENWKTTSATNMNALFHNCAEEELDLSGWDVSKVQFFCQMFEGSTNLKRIKGLEKWNTSAGLGFDEMFARCSKLEDVDLSSFNTTKAKNGTSASANNHKTATMKDMFASCNNLKKVTVGVNFAVNGNGSNTTAANKAILPTPSASYISGADGNWYNFTGDSFAPNTMKDKTAETYYASYDMVADADVIVKNGSLIDTAKAIREKNGASKKYTPAQFGTAIRAL